MPQRILSIEQVRQWEAHVFDDMNMPSLLVMESAGCGVFDVIQQRHSAASRVLLLAGTGNNGGDGFVVARHLAIAGFAVDCWVVGDESRIKGDALTMYRAMQGNAVPSQIIADESDFQAMQKREDYDLIVDALFGIGLNRPLGALPAAVIQWANQSGAVRYAVDVPSGLLCDSGQTPGAVFAADVTVTFFAPKLGQLMLPGRLACGELICLCLSAEDESPTVDGALVEWVRESDIAAWLPPRPLDAHKGDNGRGLLIAGSAGMTGAAIVAATAALRSGVGLLQGIVPASCAPAAWGSVPEWMCSGAAEDANGAFSPDAMEEIREKCDGKTALAAGPGMGQGVGARRIVEVLLDCDVPLVLDADALNIVAAGRVHALKNSRARLVLTPHPGEMARLAGIETAEVLSDPVGIARRFAQENDVVLLLKGASSVIAVPDGRVGINTTGGPQLAKGGSGDILTGILLALLCQGLPRYEAAMAAAFLLGKAAESVAMHERGVMARDVIDAIPQAMTHCCR